MKLALFAVGCVLLFFVELGYSVALQRYELPAKRSPFFKGPITAIVRQIFEERSRAPALDGRHSHAETDTQPRGTLQAAERRAAR